MPLRSVLVAAVAATLFFAQVEPLGGQLPDAWAAHWGASRLEEPTTRFSLGLGILLLTQYGSRWEESPDTAITRFDRLRTTVGYNYLSGGVQRETAPPFGLPGALTGSVGATLGVTSDRGTEWAQDELHNFRRFPHVPRVRVDSKDLLAALEAGGRWWFSWNSRADPLMFEVFPGAQGTVGTYYSELTGSLGVGVRACWLVAQGVVTGGWTWPGEPARVGDRLRSSYWQVRALVGTERTRYLVPSLPGVTFGFTWTSGAFRHVESEKLLSVAFDFASFRSNDSFRLEFVNDLLGDKDRGPTGGVRVTYVGR